MKKSLLYLSIFFVMGVSLAWPRSAPLLYDLKTGEIYAPLNEPDRSQKHLEEVQPPIHQRDYREEFIEYKRKEERDWPERDPRVDSYYRIEWSPSGTRYRDRDVYRKKAARQPPKLRTLPDGSFEKYNPETGAYESVENPNVEKE